MNDTTERALVRLAIHMASVQDGHRDNVSIPSIFGYNLDMAVMLSEIARQSHPGRITIEASTALGTISWQHTTKDGRAYDVLVVLMRDET